MSPEHKAIVQLLRWDEKELIEYSNKFQSDHILQPLARQILAGIYSEISDLMNKGTEIKTSGIIIKFNHGKNERKNA